MSANQEKFDIITTTIDRAVSWARSNSLWPMPMGISCCAIEMMAIVGSRYDVSRFGSEVLRFSPRQSDLMIVAGTLTHKMAPVVRRIYDQMPEPKWVISMGACLATGGMFDAYSVVQGLSKVLPIDAYVAGCPPRPENLLNALIEVQKKVRKRPSKSFGSINLPEYTATIPLEHIETNEQPTKPGTKIINMGPQHPSTHGVLRIVLEIEDETIIRSYPHVGYLHRGYEKLGEHRSLHQYITYTDRLDYLAPLSNNVAYALAVEKLLDLEVTPRCSYVRVICCELARISAHLLSLGTYGMDVGALSTFFYTFQQREYIYNLIEKLCGSRLTTSYTRIGGMMRDIPVGWDKELRNFLKDVPAVLDDLEGLLAHNRIWVERTKGVGVISPELAIDYALTGPNLRASGVAFDLRKAKPYLAYNDFNFDVCTRENGDCYDRYMIRIAEVRSNTKIT
jgi:NADH-quinone oxidoreductase B subunit